MRTLRILVVDLWLVFIASFFALVLRDNLELSEERIVDALPYWLLTVVAAIVVLPLLGVTRAVWRFSSMRNYIDIVAAAGATVVGALAFTFVINRLEGIPRAMPIIQGMLIVVLLIGARIAVRTWYARHQRRTRTATMPGPGETVLVVGVTKMAELYLHCIADYAPERVHVAGVLDPHESGVRTLITHPVLGPPKDVAAVLRRLEVHGVFVDRIVVAMPATELSAEAHAALLTVEAETSVVLEFLDQKMGLDDRLADALHQAPTQEGCAAAAGNPAAGGTSSVVETPVAVPYRVVKRVIDIAGATLLMVLLAPVMALVAIAVLLDIGAPMLFWQQRPGLRGRAFKLYKFRTMGAGHDADGRRLTDAERVSRLGRFLRRTRLDELPQLWSILIGTMSFVGPRPLLPVDQPVGFSKRLAVRPGLTGWAQIKGGRIISAADKAALDVWYVRNMSLTLDIRIVLGTIPMVLFGERVEDAAIARAWAEIGEAKS
ncbi:Lipid carrier : UDP-N-acetylgalactosaminyltransferase [Rhodovulum sp. PH10]|nr:Lipid carrier : UDP-N-acetylgalactosaminyltransferase [Rhodovulum sp. PH10]